MWVSNISASKLNMSFVKVVVVSSHGFIALGWASSLWNHWIATKFQISRSKSSERYSGLPMQKISHSLFKIKLKNHFVDLYWNIYRKQLIFIVYFSPIKAQHSHSLCDAHIEAAWLNDRKVVSQFPVSKLCELIIFCKLSFERSFGSEQTCLMSSL